MEYLIQNEKQFFLEPTRYFVLSTSATQAYEDWIEGRENIIEEAWMVSTPPWWLELNPEPGEAVLVTFEPVVGM